LELNSPYRGVFRRSVRGRLEALADPVAMVAMTVPDVPVIPHAPALIMASNPAATMTISWNPDPPVSFVPVVGTMVIGPVTNTDREIDCFSFWREHRSGTPQHNGQQHYHFLFHTHFLSFGRRPCNGRYFFAFFVVSFFAAASRSVFLRREARFLTLSLPWLFPIRLQPPPSYEQFQVIFLKSTSSALLMNKFDALIAIFIHPNKPRLPGEVSRSAQQYLINLWSSAGNDDQYRIEGRKAPAGSR
jgi:hypothetical protein